MGSLEIFLNARIGRAEEKNSTIDGYTTKVEKHSEGKALLTAIIPLKASWPDRANVMSWLLRENASSIHYVFVFDRPTPEIKEANRSVQSQFPNFQIDIVEGQFFGPGSARNAGFVFIDTKYVAFWDSDDNPNLEEILSILVREGEESEKVYVGAFGIEKAGQQIKRIHTLNLKQLARNPGLWRCLIPSRLLVGCEFPSNLLGEDQVFLAKVLINASSIEFVNRHFYTYSYGNQGQLTSSRDLAPLEESEKLLATISHAGITNEISRFILDLSSKQLLTLLRYGSIKQKSFSLVRLSRRVLVHGREGIASILSMLQVPIRERFNA